SSFPPIQDPASVVDRDLVAQFVLPRSLSVGDLEPVRKLLLSIGRLRPLGPPGGRAGSHGRVQLFCELLSPCHGVAQLQRLFLKPAPTLHGVLVSGLPDLEPAVRGRPKEDIPVLRRDKPHSTPRLEPDGGRSVEQFADLGRGPPLQDVPLDPSLVFDIEFIHLSESLALLGLDLRFAQVHYRTQAGGPQPDDVQDQSLLLAGEGPKNPTGHLDEQTPGLGRSSDHRHLGLRHIPAFGENHAIGKNLSLPLLVLSEDLLALFHRSAPRDDLRGDPPVPEVLGKRLRRANGWSEQDSLPVSGVLPVSGGDHWTGTGSFERFPELAFLVVASGTGDRGKV